MISRLGLQSGCAAVRTKSLMRLRPAPARKKKKETQTYCNVCILISEVRLPRSEVPDCAPNPNDVFDRSRLFFPAQRNIKTIASGIADTSLGPIPFVNFGIYSKVGSQKIISENLQSHSTKAVLSSYAYFHQPDPMSQYETVMLVRRRNQGARSCVGAAEELEGRLCHP